MRDVVTQILRCIRALQNIPLWRYFSWYSRGICTVYEPRCIVLYIPSLCWIIGWKALQLENQWVYHRSYQVLLVQWCFTLHFLYMWMKFLSNTLQVDKLKGIDYKKLYLIFNDPSHPPLKLVWLGELQYRGATFGAQKEQYASNTSIYHSRIL